MADELYGGSLGSFADSMADEIEQALNAVRKEAGMEPLPTSDAKDRHILFVAIARGVINHLKAKEKAFQIKVDGGAHTHTGSLSIQVKPPPPPKMP